MQNILSNLVTRLKRNAHREISPDELHKARHNLRDINNDSVCKRTTEYSIINGNPQIKITYEPIDHAGRTIMYNYDSDGKLIKRTLVQMGDIEFNRYIEIREFDPPGRWFGKKIDS